MQIVQRMTTTVVILSLALAGLVGGVAVPAMLSMRALKEDIHESQRTIDERFAAQRYVRNAMSSFQTTLTQVGTLSSVAVRKGQELDFVTAIEAIADARGVEQKLSLETANQKDITSWERNVPVRIEATGAYPDVVGFLSDIERLPYLVSVNSITITAPREGSAGTDNGRVSAQINGTVYWQGDNAPAFVSGKAKDQATQP